MSKKTSISESKKGGASSHLRPCKIAYCDKHNERLDETPSNKNIRPQFSGNSSVWKHPDVPNLVTLDRQIRKDYFMAHGRHMPERGPSKASPVKESVTLMPNGNKETDDIQRKIVERIEKVFGIRCIRMYNHRDEFCDETGEFNWHGHEVWDMYDHEAHRMRVLTPADCRKWQDIVAEETGMPRGNPAYETRRKWLSANEYKITKQTETMAKKKAEEEALDKRIHEKEGELAKMAKNPLTRMIAGVRTKMSGNYTQEEVAEIMAKADAEADERVRAAKEQAEQTAAAASEEAEAKILALQADLEKARRSLSNERKNKKEAIRIAVEKAVQDAQVTYERAIQSAVAKSTAELNEVLSKKQADLKAANSKIQELMASSFAPALITRTFLAILNDENVKGSQKNDVLALFTDHLDQNGRKVLSQILANNGINRTLRTTKELEYLRMMAANQSLPMKKGNGIKL